MTGKSTAQQLKSIGSYEKCIQEHQKKLEAFKENPTIRPGMENLSKEVIKRQWQRRINHLEAEIRTFQENIQKIKRGRAWVMIYTCSNNRQLMVSNKSNVHSTEVRDKSNGYLIALLDEREKLDAEIIRCLMVS